MTADSLAPDPLSALSPLATEVAATMARIASDIAIVIDGDGIIRSVAEGAAPLSATPWVSDWVGRRWVDTVTADTRLKIEALLSELRTSGVTQRREVNHPLADGDQVPVAWAAIRLGDAGPVVAVGRDLRAVAAIQRRFLDVQHDMERDYWQRRQAENSYRLLFQVASDGVLVLDGDSLQVLDANEAAQALLPAAGAALAGQTLSSVLPGAARAAVLELLTAARCSGRAGEIRVRIGSAAWDLSATPFRAGDRQQLLVRARRDEAGDADGVRGRRASGSSLPAAMTSFVESTPDGVVITDSAGRVLLANPAFVALVQQGSEAQLHGRMLSELVGDAGGQWHALMMRTRLHGLAPRSRLQVQRGLLAIAVEASAALLAEGDQEHLGFIVRAAEPPTAPAVASLHEAAQAMLELGAQVGHVPLAELMREAAHLAERQFVETALLRSGGRLGVAAQMLSIAPEALMLRMRRLGLAALKGGTEPPPTALN